MKNARLKPLATVFVASGLWDSIAGVLYLFFIGTGRPIDNPPTHSFYSVFLASFFFCFAYIQFAASRNIRRYCLAVGCLIIGRVMYVIQLYGFMGFADGFPPTFWFTGIIDGTFVVLYIVLAHRGGLRVRDLFLPQLPRPGGERVCSSACCVGDRAEAAGGEAASFSPASRCPCP